MGSNRGEVITLTRLAAAFPDITAMSAQKSFGMEGFRMGHVPIARYSDFETCDDKFVFLLTPASFALLDQKDFPWDSFKGAFTTIIHEISYMINPAYVLKCREDSTAALAESEYIPGSHTIPPS